MAYEIDGEEVGVFPVAEKALQSCYLAGRAYEHHLTSLLQELLRLAVCVLYAALQVLAAHHWIDSLDGLRTDMVHFPSLVIDCTEDHPTSLDDVSCQWKEYAARRAVHALLLVAVLRRKDGEGRYLVLRTEDGANLLAQSALGAYALVHLGIEKSLAVFTQGDAVLGAMLKTCSATAAFPPLLLYSLSTY